MAKARVYNLKNELIQEVDISKITSKTFLNNNTYQYTNKIITPLNVCEVKFDDDQARKKIHFKYEDEKRNWYGTLRDAKSFIKGCLRAAKYD